MPEATWITEVPSRAMSAYTHYFVVAPNTGEEVRETEILFEDKENGISETVRIYQVPPPYIAVAMNEYKFSYKAATLDFTLQTNTELEISINVDWIKQVQPRTRGIVEMDLSFDIEENTDPEQERTGVITISDKLHERVQDIYVTQDPYGKQLVSTTYNMYMAWGVTGYIQDEVGNIFFNPSLDDPADWYEADYTPVCQRVRTYSDGSQEASSWNDYGFIFSGAEFEEAYWILDNELNSFSGLPEYGVFVDFVNEEIPKMEFKDNALVKSYYGSMRDVVGMDFKNFRTSERENCYVRYFMDGQTRQETPFIGEYDLYELTGPNRVWFTDEQLEKLEAYFGREVMVSDILDLTVGQLVDILDTEGLENPCLGLPNGTYTFAYHHSLILGIDGAGTVDWDGSVVDLVYGCQFTESDGFFIEQEADNGPLMLTYPTNIGSQSYRTEMEVLEDDDKKTVGVMKVTLFQDFKYENTANGFPQIPNGGINFSEYYPSFSFQTVMYDTLVAYKYKEDDPFKVKCHYFYHDYGGVVFIEVNPERVHVVNGEERPDYEYEVTTDVDWIHEAGDNLQGGSYRSEAGLNGYMHSWSFRNDSNYSLRPRVGHVTFKMKGSDYQETVRVVQRGTDYTKIYQNSYHFDYKGGTFTIDGRSNWPEHVIARWDVDWIEKVTDSRNMQDISLGPVRVKENTSPEPRSATITVMAGKYLNGEVAKITVTQDGCPNASARSVSSGKAPFWNSRLEQTVPLRDVGWKGRMIKR